MLHLNALNELGFCSCQVLWVSQRYRQTVDYFPINTTSGHESTVAVKPFNGYLSQLSNILQ